MGKSTGKTLLGIAGFFVGYANPGMFGVAAGSNAALIGGLYGAAIGSSIWAATHQPNQDSNSAAFDQIANTVSSRDRIPVIYGTRKWGGNKVYHKTSSDKQSLVKDIVWCEGDIDSITDVRANDLPLETVKETKITNVLSIIYNGSSTMATYSFIDRGLFLYENGVEIYSFPCENTNPTVISSYINLLPGWSSNPLDNTATGSEINSVSNVNAKNTTTILTKTKTTTIQKGIDGCSLISHTGIDMGYPDTYMVTGSYRGCAWTRFYLKSGDNLSGDPTVTAIIKGKKITDTRTGTYAYSSNPAMCVRDYLLSKRYGAGHFIDASNLDEDSFKEVAAYCDQLVTTKVPNTLSTADQVNNRITELQTMLSYPNLSQDTVEAINNEIADLKQALININTTPVEYILEVAPRYSLNIIINEDKSHVEILSDMLAVFGGFITYCNGVVGLRCEKASSACYDFNDTNIIQDTLTHTQYPIDNSPNRYSVTFYDPANQYTGVKVLVEDTVSQRDREKIINKEVDLKGCTCQSQALRLARMYRDKVLTSQIVITFDTATQAMHLEPGDVITVSKYIYPNGQKTLLFDKVPFRILEIAEESEIYSIKAEQYNASIYNDSIGSQIQVKNYVTIPDPFTEDIPHVENVTVSQQYYVQKDGTVVSDIIVSCDPPYYYSFSKIVYNYTTSDSNGLWYYAGESIDGNFIIHNAIVGKTYTIGVNVVNSANRREQGVCSNPITVIGKDTPPSDVSSLNVSINSQGQAVLTWTPNQDPDIRGYEVRTGGTTWELSSPIKNDPTSKYPTIIFESKYLYNIPVSANYKFFIKAIDNSGNYSVNAKSSNLSVKLEPDDVDDFIAFQNGTYVDFAWTKKDTSLSYEIRQGASFDNGQLVATGITGSSWQTEVDTETLMYYHIKAINTLGKYSVNAVSKLINITDLPVRNIVLEFDEMSLQDGLPTQTEFQSREFTYNNFGMITNKFTYDNCTNERYSDYSSSYSLTLLFKQKMWSYVSPFMPLLKQSESFVSFVSPLMPILKHEDIDTEIGVMDGEYLTQVRDIGSIVSARISVLFATNELSHNGLSVSLQFRTSLNGSTWSEWEDFQPRTTTFRYMQFKVSMSTDDASNIPFVSLFRERIDVPDTTKSGNSTVTSNGTYVFYGHQYYTVPNPVVTALGVNCVAEVSLVDTVKFFIKVKNMVTGEYVDSSVNWFVNGY